MPTGLTLLAGYGSDSDDDGDDDDASHAVASSSTTAVSHPPRTSSASRSRPSGSALSLPPPTASAKRKVIKVDSLESVEHSQDGEHPDQHVRTATDSKRPKLGSSAPGSSTTNHSLFGMLPAPRRKDDEVRAERNKEAQARRAARAMEDSHTASLTEARLRFNEDAVRGSSPDVEGATGMLGGSSPESTSSKPKGKNNDAFRAMLGLKPTAKKPPAPAPAISCASALQVPSSKPAQLSVPSQTAAGSNTPAPSKPDSAPVDFFSLGSARATTSTVSTTQTSALSISAAPIIEQRGDGTNTDAQDDAAEYPGWQLDPDGSWVPVTAEAQAQLLAYQQTVSAPHNAASVVPCRGAANLDGTRDLLAAGLTAHDIRAFDASTAAREAYLPSDGADGDNDKYAAAAEFAAGNREVQQRKPGMLRGLRKGQLSSIISLANENRSKLEERWQRGRDAQARRSNQYGF